MISTLGGSGAEHDVISTKLGGAKWVTLLCAPQQGRVGTSERYSRVFSLLQNCRLASLVSGLALQALGRISG